MKKLFLFIYILIMPFMPYVKAEIAESYNINQTNNNFVIVGAQEFVPMALVNLTAYRKVIAIHHVLLEHFL